MPGKMPNWVQKFGYGEFIHLEHRNCKACMMKGDKLFREVDANCFDADVRLKEMDETQVTIQVLSTIPVLFNYWAKPKDGLETARFFNDHIAETVNKNPQRFIGIGTVPLQDTDLAIAEMERTDYVGDSFPLFWPNVGPEISATPFGCELTFTETTSWSKPVIHADRDWAGLATRLPNFDNLYWQTVERMTDYALARCENRYVVGLSDLHGNYDILAALRDRLKPAKG